MAGSGRRANAAHPASEGRGGAAPGAAGSLGRGSRTESGGAASDGAERGGRGARRRPGSQEPGFTERLIAGVPARIMRPRLVFLACLVVIVAFGLLMVYSASSVEALQEKGDSAYYLVRQAIFVAGSLVAAAIICKMPWSWFRELAWPVWVVVLFMLVVVFAVGIGGASWGASRWIDLGFFTLQPSEFAKPAVVLVAAKLFSDCYEHRAIDPATMTGLLAFCLLAPGLLIYLQPDLGTLVIIAGAVFFMACLAGVSNRTIAILLAVGAAAVAAAIAFAPYRVARFFASLDPWSDPYGDGYQATLAIMAFASGGLFGRGIGGSTMKYSYLPEAHNDYILAIIGEEVGFVGTLLFIVVFLAMIAAAFLIARRAPTLHAQLLASGCALVLVIQFFINVLGILGAIPMTGKPLPFVSYGGSSVLSCLILAAIILRVSLASDVSTAADARRDSLAVMDEADAASSHMGRSTAGAVRVRRADTAAGDAEAAPASRPGTRRQAAFTVYEGGARDGSQAGGRDRMPPRERRSGADARRGAYERIDLNADAGSRLRPEGRRPRVDYHGTAGEGRARRSGGTRRGTGPSGRRDRHDR